MRKESQFAKEHIESLLNAHLFTKQLERIVAIANDRGITLTTQQCRDLHANVLNRLNDEYVFLLKNELDNL